MPEQLHLTPRPRSEVDPNPTQFPPCAFPGNAQEPQCPRPAKFLVRWPNALGRDLEPNVVATCNTHLPAMRAAIERYAGPAQPAIENL